MSILLRDMEIKEVLHKVKLDLRFQILEMKHCSTCFLHKRPKEELYLCFKTLTITIITIVLVYCSQCHFQEKWTTGSYNNHRQYQAIQKHSAAEVWLYKMLRLLQERIRLRSFLTINRTLILKIPYQEMITYFKVYRDSVCLNS